MGLFSWLLDTSSNKRTVNEDTFRNMVRLAKVSLALNSGGCDSGGFGFEGHKDHIIFTNNGRNSFFEYRDKLGISEEVLLRNQVGGCPASEWEQYLNSMRTVQIRGDAYSFTAVIPIAKNTDTLYISKLAQLLAKDYPNLAVDASNNSIHMYTSSKDKDNTTYR